MVYLLCFCVTTSNGNHDENRNNKHTDDDEDFNHHTAIAMISALHCRNNNGSNKHNNDKIVVRKAIIMEIKDVHDDDNENDGDRAAGEEPFRGGCRKPQSYTERKVVEVVGVCKQVELGFGVQI